MFLAKSVSLSVSALSEDPWIIGFLISYCGIAVMPFLLSRKDAATQETSVSSSTRSELWCMSDCLYVSVFVLSYIRSPLDSINNF